MAKILYISPNILRQNHGGVVTHIKLLLASDISKKHELDWDYLEWENNIFFLKIIRRLLAIRKKINKFKPDIIHINASIYFSLVIKAILYKILLINKKSIKIILQLHGGVFENIKKGKIWIRILLERSHAVLLLTKEQYDGAINHIGIKDSKSLGIAVNYINNIEVVNKKKDDLQNDSKIRLLFLSRIVKEKGIFDIINIIDRVGGDYQEQLEVLVAGNGKDLEDAKAIVVSKGLGTQFKFLGYVTGDTKADLYNSSNIFIFPTSWNEGMPYSLLEAIRAGMPVLSTAVGNIPFLVKNAQNGYLISIDQINEWVEKIEYLVDNPSRAEDMGRNSRKLFLEKFCMDISGSKWFLDLYAKVLKN